MGGQNNHYTSFGMALENIARHPDVDTVVEIGAWDGQGSTLQLVKGLASSPHKKNPPRLTTFEADLSFFEKARLFWSRQTHLLEQVHVDVVRGRVATHFPAWGDVVTHPGFHEQMVSWYERESAIYHGSEPIPVSPPVDLIVLDGGEYTTTADWESLMLTKPKFVAVNNCNLFKGEKVFASLSKSPNWSNIDDGTDHDIAWAIFERTCITPRSSGPTSPRTEIEKFVPDADEEEEESPPAPPAQILPRIVEPVVIAWDDEDDLPPAAEPADVAEIPAVTPDAGASDGTEDPLPPDPIAPGPIAPDPIAPEKKKKAGRVPKVAAAGEKKARRRVAKKKVDGDPADARTPAG